MDKTQTLNKIRTLLYEADEYLRYNNNKYALLISKDLEWRMLNNRVDLIGIIQSLWIDDNYEAL